MPAHEQDRRTIDRERNGDQESDSEATIPSSTNLGDPEKDRQSSESLEVIDNDIDAIDLEIKRIKLRQMRLEIKREELKLEQDKMYAHVAHEKKKSGSESGSSGVIIYEPRSFDEVLQIVNSLGNGKAVIVNVAMMEPDQAQRSVDFIAGTTFGLNGHQERVGESIFFFAPSNMEVSIVGSEQDNMSDSAPKPKPIAEGRGEKLDLSTSTPSVETAEENDISQSLEEEIIESASETNTVLPKDEMQ